MNNVKQITIGLYVTGLTKTTTTMTTKKTADMDALIAREWNLLSFLYQTAIFTIYLTF